MIPEFQISQEGWNPSRTKIRIAANDPAVSWHAVVRGPFSQFGRTLPTNFPVNRSLSEPNVGYCDVLDACPWLPKLPLWYEASITVSTAGEEQATQQRIGLSDIRTVADRCYVGGERTIFRIVEQSAVAECDWADWRETRTAMLVREWSPALLADALSEGVFLFVATDDEISAHNWRLLESFACVAGVIPRQNSPRVETTRLWVLGDEMRVPSPTSDQPPFDGVWATEHRLAAHAEQSVQALPIFACDTPVEGPFDDLLQARSYCDQLQRRTASLVQCAGYAVLSNDGAQR